VGNPMSETTAKIDEKGRIMIPKNIRKAAKIKPGTYVNIKATDTTIIIEHAESIAEKYGGLFQITKWPEDLDEFMVEATRKWWTNHAST
jgi:AbrB family looped-hinge helix DNA binding protein